MLVAGPVILGMQGSSCTNTAVHPSLMVAEESTAQYHGHSASATISWNEQRTTPTSLLTEGQIKPVTYKMDLSSQK